LTELINNQRLLANRYWRGKILFGAVLFGAL